MEFPRGCGRAERFAMAFVFSGITFRLELSVPVTAATRRPARARSTDPAARRERQVSVAR
jgi:hypothetical protein